MAAQIYDPVDVRNEALAITMDCLLRDAFFAKQK